MFSLVLRSPPSLASKLVFVQYLIALATVQGLGTAFGDKIGLCIKWPNDLYADLGLESGQQRYQKIGGILVNNTYSQGNFALVVGQSNSEGDTGHGLNVCFQDVASTYRISDRRSLSTV